MRFDQFDFLVEISKHKSMNAASKTLHVSPQALSISIKKFEDELGFSLLDRTTMGVSLTPAAKKLLGLYEPFLQGIIDLQQEFSSHSKTGSLSGTMILATPYGFCENVLPNLFTDLYQENPNLHIETIPCDYEDLYFYVKKSHLEYAITYKILINGENQTKNLTDEYTFWPLFSVEFFARIPNCLAISQYKHISLKTFLKNPVVLYAPSKALMYPILEYSANQPQLIEVPSPAIMQHFLSKGLGVSIGMKGTSINYTLTAPDKNVSIIPFQESVIGFCGYITRADSDLSESALQQLRWLKSYFKNNI